MFKINQGKGFQITYANGWTVSVQFGPGNYTDSPYRNSFAKDAVEKAGKAGAPNAEIAAWDANGVWHKFENESTVDGWVTPDALLKFMNEVAALPASIRKVA